jgi:hypothetical protein
MSKIFLALVFPILLFGFKWDYTHEFTLKKDQVAKIKVTKRSDKSVQWIEFRWTLYTNDRLILLTKYDSFPNQYTLQHKYKRNSIKIDLRDDYGDGFKRAYMILTFKDFGSSKATLITDITDPKKSIEIEFVDPKK